MKKILKNIDIFFFFELLKEISINLCLIKLNFYYYYYFIFILFLLFITFIFYYYIIYFLLLYYLSYNKLIKINNNKNIFYSIFLF